MGYQNFFVTKLFTDIDAIQTTITLETPPTQTSGRLVLEARNVTQREIISYSSVVGNQVQGVVRGINSGGVGRTHSRNALVEMNLTAEDIADLYTAFNTFSASNGTGWLAAVTMPSSIVYNGQYSYTVTYPSSVAAYKSKGTKSRFTRNVAAPTQSTTLNGTSQYYTKASPTGVSFTDDFTVSAWIFQTSYQVGYVIARRNATDGWVFQLSASGRPMVFGFNTGGGNLKQVMGMQSIPLNKWTHVAITMDFSGSIGNVYLNGALVPSVVTTTGTLNSIAQTGDLRIGADHSGTSNFFKGNLAQVAVFSSILSAATIRSYISQTLTGAESTLISAYSFNNSVNDLNVSTANNMTANGGVVATTLSSPFGNQLGGTLEYGITMDLSANGLVETVQVPHDCALPTTGTITAISYSTGRAPLLFPTSRDKWRIRLYHRDETPTGMTTGATKSAGGAMAIVVPLGEWILRYHLYQYSDLGGAQSIIHFSILSTALDSAALTVDSGDWNIVTRGSNYDGATFWASNHMKEGTITVPAPTTLYTNTRVDGTGIGNHRYNYYSAVACYMEIENPYL